MSSATARLDGRRAVAPRALTVLEAMRPKHWIKNAFVLAGIVFAGKVLDIQSLLAALAAAIAFCLASGATYLVNDVRDMEVDREDPRTAGRPAARGATAPRAALVAGAVAASGALGIASLVNGWLLICVVAYLVLQVAYNAKLKDVVAMDVLVITTGFVLRAAAGGLAIGVPVTAWLLIATALLAALLGLAKRRSQVAALARGDAAPRPVLMRYSLRVLDPAIDVLAAGTFALYVAYGALGAPSQWMLLTTPFVLFGLLRVRATMRAMSALPYEPALLVLRDRALLACVGVWAACAAAIAAIVSA